MSLRPLGLLTWGLGLGLFAYHWIFTLVEGDFGVLVRTLNIIAIGLIVIGAAATRFWSIQEGVRVPMPRGRNVSLWVVLLIFVVVLFVVRTVSDSPFMISSIGDEGWGVGKSIAYVLIWGAYWPVFSLWLGAGREYVKLRYADTKGFSAHRRR
jgi:hypothetical protein